jgi:hypothetical protein
VKTFPGEREPVPQLYVPIARAPGSPRRSTCGLLRGLPRPSRRPCAQRLRVWTKTALSPV